jgi:hypothetical protein
VALCLRYYDAGGSPERGDEKAAVKATLAAVTARAPGSAVEIRVPPYAAVQAIGGVRHRRGTPPAVVQLDARTLLQLAVGTISWADARAAGGVRASGERSDLAWLLPIFTDPAA